MTLKTDLASLKSKVNKLDVDKFKTVTVHGSKISNAIDNVKIV